MGLLPLHSGITLAVSARFISQYRPPVLSEDEYIPLPHKLWALLSLLLVAHRAFHTLVLFMDG